MSSALAAAETGIYDMRDIYLNLLIANRLKVNSKEKAVVLSRTRAPEAEHEYSSPINSGV
jgi:hypothetical protein